MDAQPANLEAKFADVSVNVAAIDKSFSYSVPPELRGEIQPGCLVVVPFGKQIVQGVVLALSDKLELEANIRDILSLNSEETVLTPQQLQPCLSRSAAGFGCWIRGAACSPLCRRAQRPRSAV